MAMCRNDDCVRKAIKLQSANAFIAHLTKDLENLRADLKVEQKNSADLRALLRQRQPRSTQRQESQSRSSTPPRGYASTRDNSPAPTRASTPAPMMASLPDDGPAAVSDDSPSPQRPPKSAGEIAQCVYCGYASKARNMSKHFKGDVKTRPRHLGVPPIDRSSKPDYPHRWYFKTSEKHQTCPPEFIPNKDWIEQTYWSIDWNWLGIRPEGYNQAPSGYTDVESLTEEVEEQTAGPSQESTPVRRSKRSRKSPELLPSEPSSSSDEDLQEGNIRALRRSQLEAMEPFEPHLSQEDSESTQG